MADAKKPPADAAPAKPKSKLLLLIALVLLIVALAAGGAFFLLKKNDGGEGAHPAEKKKVDAGAPPVFYRFEKPFTVKLQTESQEAYLQTEIQLRLLEAHDQELIKQYEPELKYRLTLALMEKKAADLGTAAGVQNLANELRDIANNVVAPSAAPAAAPVAAAAPATTMPPASAAPAAPAAPAAAPAPAAKAAADAPVQAVLFSTFIIQ